MQRTIGTILIGIGIIILMVGGFMAARMMYGIEYFAFFIVPIAAIPLGFGAILREGVGHFLSGIPWKGMQKTGLRIFLYILVFIAAMIAIKVFLVHT